MPTLLRGTPTSHTLHPSRGQKPVCSVQSVRCCRSHATPLTGTETICCGFFFLCELVTRYTPHGDRNVSIQTPSLQVVDVTRYTPHGDRNLLLLQLAECLQCRVTRYTPHGDRNDLSYKVMPLVFSHTLHPSRGQKRVPAGGGGDVALWVTRYTPHGDRNWYVSVGQGEVLSGHTLHPSRGQKQS